MSVPAGRLQFFTLEATDYLERLTILVERPNPPEGAELVRLVRALRGAALMAGLPPFANAAMAVEYVAKGYRDDQVPWDAERVDLFANAVIVFRRLAAQAGAWSDVATAEAEALAARCRPDITPFVDLEARDELKPSVRTFVGREGAQIAGTLELVAQALELGNPGTTADVVVQRLQPVRGLAGLPKLAPLPEFLDGVELAIAMVREGTAPPGAAPALREAARAIAILARDIADAGVANGDHPTVIAGARALGDTFANDDDVVPIESLFVTRDPSPVVRPGHSVDRSHATDAHLELTGLADRLRQGADQLTSAMGATGRALTLFGLGTHLAILSRGLGQRHPVLASLVRAIRGAIRSGGAAAAPTQFGRLLVEAADELTTVSSSRNAILFHDQLDGVVTGLANLGPEPVAVETLAPDVVTDDETDVVPIESLAPDIAAPTEPSPFEHSFSTYHALIGAGELPVAEPTPTDIEVTPIDALLYRGRAALERADVVRRQLSVALKSDRPFPELEPLVSELIDLVPLALAE